MSKAKVTAEQLNASAWAAALAAPQTPDEVPPGWHTAKELSAMLGKAGPTIGTLLSRAIAQGKCERRDFRIISGQVTRPIPHYRLLK
jgi:hypothetical protein